jgi:hypothetical protein
MDEETEFVSISDVAPKIVPGRTSGMHDWSSPVDLHDGDRVVERAEWARVIVSVVMAHFSRIMVGVPGYSYQCAGRR